MTVLTALPVVPARLDHMFLDGLEDADSPETKGQLMGQFANACASESHFSRQDQDDDAIESTKRAQKAIHEGAFKWEIEPITITITGRGRTDTRENDEQPLKAQLDKVPQLKPAFRQDGTVTAANANAISDGAAVWLLMRASTAKEFGLTPVAKILGNASHAQKPRWFTTAPPRQCASS